MFILYPYLANKVNVHHLPSPNLKYLNHIYLYLADFVWKTCIYPDSTDILKWIYLPNIGQDTKGTLMGKVLFWWKEKKKKKPIHLHVLSKQVLKSLNIKMIELQFSLGCTSNFSSTFNSPFNSKFIGVDWQLIVLNFEDFHFAG